MIQLVSCFAKEKIGFLSGCHHDTLFKVFFFFNFCRFACLFFLTFLSRFACLYAESFGRSDDKQPFRTLLIDYFFQDTLQSSRAPGSDFLFKQ